MIARHLSLSRESRQCNRKISFAKTLKLVESRASHNSFEKVSFRVVDGLLVFSAEISKSAARADPVSVAEVSGAHVCPKV